MRIDRLRVKNFRCFKDQTFAFDEHLNVLIGDNGAGKTALIEAVAVAAGSFLLGIDGEGGRSIHREDIRREARTVDGQVIFSPRPPTSVEADGLVLGNLISWCRVLGSEKGRTTTAEAKGIKALAEQAQHRVREGADITLPVVAYYGAGRAWQTIKQTKATRQELGRAERQPLRGYRDAIDPRVDPRSFLQWMRLQAQIRFEEGAEPNGLRLVRNAMTIMTEGATDVDYRAKWNDIVVFFEDRDPQAFSRLSDGQRNVLALAGDLATRIVRLNSHLGEKAVKESPGVVLIDEIGLHLHPTWQRRIVGDLRSTFENVQFIVTTHSPQVLGEVPPDHVIRLVEDGWEHPDRTYGLDSNAVLKTVMGAESQNKETEDALGSIYSAIQHKDLRGAESLIRKLRKRLHDEQGVDYDPPDLRRAEATLKRVSLIGR